MSNKMCGHLRVFYNIGLDTPKYHESVECPYCLIDRLQRELESRPSRLVNTSRIVRWEATRAEICAHNRMLGEENFCPECPRG